MYFSKVIGIFCNMFFSMVVDGVVIIVLMLFNVVVKFLLVRFWSWFLMLIFFVNLCVNFYMGFSVCFVNIGDLLNYCFKLIIEWVICWSWLLVKFGYFVEVIRILIVVSCFCGLCLVRLFSCGMLIILICLLFFYDFSVWVWDWLMYVILLVRIGCIVNGFVGLFLWFF